MGDFLKDLPCYNSQNFQKIEPSTDSQSSMGRQTSSSVKRPPVFIQTKDYPSEQVVITTEKTNILLRYLQQINKKNKREGAEDVQSESPQKRMKMTS